MPQEFQLRDAKDTLLLVYNDAVVAKPAEDVAEKALVIGQVGAGDKDVINVDENALESSEDLVHQTLAGLSSVPEAERHTNCLV